jgi:hypothetical protein
MVLMHGVPTHDPTRPQVRHLREHGERYCSRHWSSITAEFSGHVPEAYLSKYCFASAYIAALLTHGLGFEPDEERLEWTNHLESLDSGARVPLTWVLGAAVHDAMHEVAVGEDADAATPSARARDGGGGFLERLQQREPGGGPGRPAALLVLPVCGVLCTAAALALWLRSRRRRAREPVAAAPRTGAPPQAPRGAGGHAGDGDANGGSSASFLAARVSSTSAGRAPHRLGSSGGTGGASRGASPPDGSPPRVGPWADATVLQHSSVVRALYSAMRRPPSFTALYMGPDSNGGGGSAGLGPGPAGASSYAAAGSH